MRTGEQEKICVHCEGRIAADATVCPYCASEQDGRPLQGSLFQSQSLEDSLTSLYTPPYQGRKPEFPESEEQEEIVEDVAQAEGSLPVFEETAEEVTPQKSSLLPLVLLMGGAQLGLLGLMQLFFGKGGVLRLEWNASYWFIYMLLAAPALYFGWKKLND